MTLAPLGCYRHVVGTKNAPGYTGPVYEANVDEGNEKELILSFDDSGRIRSEGNSGLNYSARAFKSYVSNEECNLLVNDAVRQLLSREHAHERSFLCQQFGRMIFFGNKKSARLFF